YAPSRPYGCAAGASRDPGSDRSVPGPLSDIRSAPGANSIRSSFDLIVLIDCREQYHADPEAGSVQVSVVSRVSIGALGRHVRSRERGSPRPIRGTPENPFEQAGPGCNVQRPSGASSAMPRLRPLCSASPPSGI